MRLLGLALEQSAKALDVLRVRVGVGGHDWRREVTATDGRYIAPLVDLNVSHDDDDGDARDDDARDDEVVVARGV